jgi:hypothetical protein
MIEIISATRLPEAEFWDRAALGISQARVPIVNVHDGLVHRRHHQGVIGGQLSDRRQIGSKNRKILRRNAEHAAITYRGRSEALRIMEARILGGTFDGTPRSDEL